MALLYCAYTFLGDTGKPTARTTADLSVTVATPQQGRIARIISATGVTVPREEIYVMTELSGVRVSEVLADVGDHVGKGQKLAVLNGRSQAHQVEQLKSDYERASDAFARVDEIKNTGAVSRQLVTEKRTAMHAAKALLDDAELNLMRCIIRAPEAGVIFERRATIGGLVTTSEPLFRIVRQNEIELDAQVPESVLSGLKVGQPASVTLTGESAPIHGTVRIISPQVDNMTRMASIRVELPSTAPLLVGLFSTVRITLSERVGMLLPVTAVQQDSTGSFVWVINTDDRAERSPITVALSDDKQAMVDAIATDARVVARAGAFIREGDRVHVVEGR